MWSAQASISCRKTTPGAVMDGVVDQELEVAGEEELSGVSDQDSESPDEEEENEFSSPWAYSDVVFIVEGRKLHVNKATLRMVSPVFEAMFRGAFDEATAKEIPLPEKCYGEMVEFFRCIHPQINKDVSGMYLVIARVFISILTSICHGLSTACKMLKVKTKLYFYMQMNKENKMFRGIQTCHFLFISNIISKKENILVPYKILKLKI